MNPQPIEINPQFVRDMEAKGYEHLRRIKGWGLCGIYRFVFTVGLCALSPEQIVQRWCYASYAEAKDALEKWNGEGNPPGDWIKSKGLHGEYPNPNA